MSMSCSAHVVLLTLLLTACGSYVREVQTISFSNGCVVEVSYAGTEHWLSPSTTAGFAAVTTPSDRHGNPCPHSLVALGQAAEAGMAKPLIEAVTTTTSTIIAAEAFKEGAGNIRPDQTAMRLHAEGGDGGSAHASSKADATSNAHANTTRKGSRKKAVFHQGVWY